MTTPCLLIQMYDMWCEANSQAEEEVPLRNCGDIPVTVSLSVSNSMFSVSPGYIDLEPGEKSSLLLTFTPESTEYEYSHTTHTW